MNQSERETHEVTLNYLKARRHKIDVAIKEIEKMLNDDDKLQESFVNELHNKQTSYGKTRNVSSNYRPDQAILLLSAIQDAARRGVPFTKTEKSGFSQRRHELPCGLDSISDNLLLTMVDDLLKDNKIGKFKAPLGLKSGKGRFFDTLEDNSLLNQGYTLLQK